MKAREGDLIETLEGNIFDVKGLVHPPNKTIAFIRFTPDPNGERTRDSVKYTKVYPLRERYELLRNRFPEYLVFDPVFGQWLCEVPTKVVKEHCLPKRFLSQLRLRKSRIELESDALDFARLLRTEARVQWNTLGISGSLLVGLSTSASDIDLIVYGSKNCTKLHEVLESIVHEKAGLIRPYDEQDLRALFDFRSRDTEARFEDFVRTESRKVLQGRFRQRDYFIRCVKEWNETSEKYGDVRYETRGQAKIKATVADASEMIFTPCVYQITNVKRLEGKTFFPIKEIVSFRGRFCEQARDGEAVIASGTVERVCGPEGNDYFRLLLGNNVSDCLILA